MMRFVLLIIFFISWTGFSYQYSMYRSADLLTGSLKLGRISDYAIKDRGGIGQFLRSAPLPHSLIPQMILLPLMLPMSSSNALLEALRSAPPKAIISLLAFMLPSFILMGYAENTFYRERVLNALFAQFIKTFGVSRQTWHNIMISSESSLVNAEIYSMKLLATQKALIATARDGFSDYTSHALIAAKRTGLNILEIQSKISSNIVDRSSKSVSSAAHSLGRVKDQVMIPSVDYFSSKVSTHLSPSRLMKSAYSAAKRISALRASVSVMFYLILSRLNSFLSNLAVNGGAALTQTAENIALKSTGIALLTANTISNLAVNGRVALKQTAANVALKSTGVVRSVRQSVVTLQANAAAAAIAAPFKAASVNTSFVPLALRHTPAPAPNVDDSVYDAPSVQATRPFTIPSPSSPLPPDASERGHEEDDEDASATDLLDLAGKTTLLVKGIFEDIEAALPAIRKSVGATVSAVKPSVEAVVSMVASDSTPGSSVTSNKKASMAGAGAAEELKISSTEPGFRANKRGPQSSDSFGGRRGADPPKNPAHFRNLTTLAHLDSNESNDAPYVDEQKEHFSFVSAVHNLLAEASHAAASSDAAVEAGLKAAVRLDKISHAASAAAADSALDTSKEVHVSSVSAHDVQPTSQPEAHEFEQSPLSTYETSQTETLVVESVGEADFAAASRPGKKERKRSGVGRSSLPESDAIPEFEGAVDLLTAFKLVFSDLSSSNRYQRMRSRYNLKFLLSEQATGIRQVLIDEAVVALDILFRQAIYKSFAQLVQPTFLQTIPIPFVFPGVGPKLVTPKELLSTLAPALTQEEEIFIAQLDAWAVDTLGIDSHVIFSGDVLEDPIGVIRFVLSFAETGNIPSVPLFSSNFLSTASSRLMQLLSLLPSYQSSLLKVDGKESQSTKRSDQDSSSETKGRFKELSDSENSIFLETSAQLLFKLRDRFLARLTNLR